MVNPAAARLFGIIQPKRCGGVDAKTLYLHPGDRDTLLQDLRESGASPTFPEIRYARMGQRFLSPSTSSSSGTRMALSW
jgi:PAS domain-containing protein